jgi:xanthine dehydrogenase accessory factor
VNEVRALVEAFDDANMRGERCALATVVDVEGSSYRQPGARMLICEGGTSTGTISAGCLESDVIEHAKRVIVTSVAKVIEYNTASTSDEMAWGLGLGCNGIVRVLVEPLATDSLYVEALRLSCSSPVVVATVYRHELSGSAPNSLRIKTGARILIAHDGSARSDKLSGSLAAVLESEVRVLSQVGSGVHILDVGDGPVTMFIETLMPPVPLVVFGAGHDVLPIIELARNLGWQTEVVDPQARPISVERFAIADKVTLSRPEDIAAKVTITSRTFTLLMSHNYAYDLVMLKFLLASPAPYIGIMGPRDRTNRMLSELAANEKIFRLQEADASRLYSPAGLDIGSNSSADIAVSIVAEIRAVLEERRGGMLRERRGPIHDRIAHVECAPLTEQMVTVAVA